METKNKPFKIIDLKDYTKEKFVYDWGDFWFDTEEIKSLDEVKKRHWPEVKFPKNFDEEDRLECINHAYRRADEESYISDYIDTFHKRFLAELNEANDMVSFEYEECYWDSIKLKVFYGLEFLTEEVKDDDGEPYTLEQWFDNKFVDFDEIIKKVHSHMENYHAYDGEVFDEVYKSEIKEKVAEIKDKKLKTFKELKKIVESKLTTSKKAVKIQMIGRSL